MRLVFGGTDLHRKGSVVLSKSRLYFLLDRVDKVVNDAAEDLGSSSGVARVRIGVDKSMD